MSIIIIIINFTIVLFYISNFIDAVSNALRIQGAWIKVMAGIY